MLSKDSSKGSSSSSSLSSSSSTSTSSSSSSKYSDSAKSPLNANAFANASSSPDCCAIRVASSNALAVSFRCWNCACVAPSAIKASAARLPDCDTGVMECALRLPPPPALINSCNKTDSSAGISPFISKCLCKWNKALTTSFCFKLSTCLARGCLLWIAVFSCSAKTLRSTAPTLLLFFVGKPEFPLLLRLLVFLVLLSFSLGSRIPPKPIAMPNGSVSSSSSLLSSSFAELFLTPNRSHFSTNVSTIARSFALLVLCSKKVTSPFSPPFISSAAAFTNASKSSRYLLNISWHSHTPSNDKRSNSTNCRRKNLPHTLSGSIFLTAKSSPLDTAKQSLASLAKHLGRRSSSSSSSLSAYSSSYSS